MDTTNEHKIFALSGETDSKDSLDTSFRQQHSGLFNLLDSCPFLAFSPVGKRNVCNRFRITEQTLDQVLLTYVRPSEPTEVERRAADFAHLLQAIGVGESPIHKTRARVSKKGGSTC
jgi:hypothetical protein